MKNNSDFTINTFSWCIYFHVEHIQHINFQYLLSTLVILNKVILNPRELFKIEIKTLCFKISVLIQIVVLLIWHGINISNPLIRTHTHVRRNLEISNELYFETSWIYIIFIIILFRPFLSTNWIQVG